MEQVEQVQTLHISRDKAVRISSELESYVKNDISKVLTGHLHSFASKAKEIIAVDPQVASHSLNIIPGVKPIV